jgi:sugar phosphate isomerase/epimerase
MEGLMRVGVCSWSLQPENPADLVAKVKATGLSAVQLALGPLRHRHWGARRTAAALNEAGIEVLSGMMSMRAEDYTTIESIRRTGGLRPQEHWRANLRAARQHARLAEKLGIRLVSFHAGFLPDDHAHPERSVMLERLREVADVFGDRGVAVALETGQETAETLLDVLAELRRRNVGVNFDPANLLLYGMGDPVHALVELLPHLRQVHIKDARRSSLGGQWGTEVTVGTGQVDWPAFFRVLDENGVEVNLLVEREAGRRRVEDVRVAVERLQAWAPGARV